MVERIYLDSAPVIYFVEAVPAYIAAVAARLGGPDSLLVVSELTRLEYRVKPMRDGNVALLREYDEFFAGAIAQIVSLTREVLDEATEIRAQYGFKTPDAIHLAAAMTSGCDVFLTNDHRLAGFASLRVEVVEP